MIQQPHAPKMTRYNRSVLFKRIFNEVDIEVFIAGWFMTANLQRVNDIQIIYRDNLKEWLSWAFFASKLDTAILNHDRELESFVTRIEKKINYTFKQGYNTEIETIRLGFNPVEVKHKPFVLYSGIYMLESLGSLLYNLLGFQHFSENEGTLESFSYFHRKTNSGKTPIIFFHGIGGGLWCYLKFVWRLKNLDDKRDIFLFEVICVLFRFLTYQ